MTAAADVVAVYLLVDDTLEASGERTTALRMPAWPTRAVLPDSQLREDRDREVAFRWPYVRIRFTNGQAVYRVETREQGVWVGTLVEGTLWGPSPP